MIRPHLIRSVYARTIMLLTLAILVIFSLLGVVYYGIVSLEAIRRQNDQLLNSARAISEVVSDNMDSSGEITNRQITSYVNFTARSTGALVWVVNHRGEIVLFSNLPGYVIEKLSFDETLYYKMESNFLVTRRAGTSGISQSGDFGGLFAESEFNWLSAAWPIPSATGFFRDRKSVV